MDRLDQMSPGRSATLVFVVLLCVYSPTATWDLRVNTDAAMAAMPAWSIAEHGTLDLSEHRTFLEVRDVAMSESREADGALYSGRNLGPILWAVPFYWVGSPWLDGAPFPMWPAAVAAAVATAAAMAVLHAALRNLVRPTAAMAAALIMATATPTWAVSADTLWTHGPAQLALALGLLAMARERMWLVGLAFGGAILCRPDLSIAAATAGVALAGLTRRPGAIGRIGLGSAVGLIAVVAYGRIVFERWSLIGGYYVYGEMFTEYASGGGDGPLTIAASYATRTFRSWFDLDQGLLVYSPLLALLLPGVRHAWRDAPAWVRASALAGISHYLAQLIANGWWAGDFFFGYRYPLEALTLASPLLVLTWREHVSVDRARSRLVAILIVVNMLWIGYGATFEPYKG